jgi:FkbM family methyltransferase
MNQKYFSNEYISLEPDDTVFETGSYMGATTQIAAEQAKQVYAIEPSPRNINCLKYNLQDYKNVKIIECAAWNEETDLEMNYGTIPSKDSLFTPLYGSNNMKVSVPATTIAEIANQNNVSDIDFLKVEAEGAEPEIIQGIKDIIVRKIAVDCGPERNGEPVEEEVEKLLSEMGYSIEKEDRYIYAWL